jgi:hypothetical protein
MILLMAGKLTVMSLSLTEARCGIYPRASPPCSSDSFTHLQLTTSVPQSAVAQSIMPFSSHFRRMQGITDKNSCYEDQYGNLYGECYSAWDNWIRWVVLGIIIAIFFLLFLSCSCLSARRRRRQGLQPFYGTGWTQRQYPYFNPQHQGGYYGGPAAPPYAPNDGPPPYHHAPQPGIELQPPVQAYRPDGEDRAFEPPMSPPPGKKGQATIIR